MSIVPDLENLSAPWVLALTALDSVGLPSTGEIAVAIAATESSISLPLLIAVATAGAILGDTAAYAIGRVAGNRIAVRFLKPERIATVGNALDRNAPLALVGARLVAGLRGKTALLAGTTGLRYRRFAPWNALGCLVWATIVAAVFEAFGHLIDVRAVVDAAGRWGLLAAAGILALLGTRHLLRRRREA